MRCGRAFSLFELVVVVVILGLLASVAIPRVRLFTESAQENALKQSLTILTEAVERYRQEHGGASPSTAAQLLNYTDDEGNVSPSRDPKHKWGPYLLRLPPLNVGTQKGRNGIAADAEPGTDGEAGWVIDTATGTVRANLADGERDNDGVSWNSYTAGG